MPTRHYAGLSVTVGAVRELMEQILASRAAETNKAATDPHVLEALRIGVKTLDALWDELQGQSESLARERERYGEFFELSSDAYLVTGFSGTIREANRKAAELLGAPLAGVCDKPLAAFVPPEEQIGFMVRLAHLGARIGPAADAWRGKIRCEDGMTRGVHFNVRALRHPRDGAASFCWLLRPAGAGILSAGRDRA
jgi:PAS domain S-box-containing protein